MRYMVGDIRKWSFEADVFEGEYRIIEVLGSDRYRIERLEPSDELIERATHYYLESSRPYCGYVDPFGPNRREATRQEALDKEIMNRIELAGTTLDVRIMHGDVWESAF